MTGNKNCVFNVFSIPHWMLLRCFKQWRFQLVVHHIDGQRKNLYHNTLSPVVCVYLLMLMRHLHLKFISKFVTLRQRLICMQMHRWQLGGEPMSRSINRPVLMYTDDKLLLRRWGGEEEINSLSLGWWIRSKNKCWRNEQLKHEQSQFRLCRVACWTCDEFKRVQTIYLKREEKVATWACS